MISDTGSLEFTPPIERLLYSFVYFFAFIVAMRLDLRVTILVLVLIFSIYFLESNKKFYLEKGRETNSSEDKATFSSHQYWLTWGSDWHLFRVHRGDFVGLNQLESVLYYAIMGLLVIGFVSYGGEVHDTVRRSRNQLTWWDVLTDDRHLCKLKNRESFWHYLKVGLRMGL